MTFQISAYVSIDRGENAMRIWRTGYATKGW